MPSGTNAEKQKKRRAVARGVIAGMPTAAIAVAAGCKQRHVQRLALEPETQFLITEAMRPHRERLLKCAAKAVNAVEKALGARKTDKADHIVRMRAVERYGELLALTQGGKPQELVDGAGQVTWEQFTMAYERRTVVQ